MTGRPLAPERQRAWNAMEWAQMHGDDLAGSLRLDPDDDAEALQAIEDALLASGDYFYSAAALDAARADYQLALEALGEPCAECGHIDWRSEPPSYTTALDAARAEADTFRAALERIVGEDKFAVGNSRRTLAWAADIAREALAGRETPK